MRFIIILSLTALTSCSINKNNGGQSQAKNPNPSSEIPDRRDFPINHEINPCQDFYEYTCSKVLKGFKLRDDRRAHSFSFDDSYERLLSAKKQYFNDISHKSNLSPRAQELKDFYLSCTDQKSRAKEEIQKVKTVVNKVMSLKNRQQFADFIVQMSLENKKSFLRNHGSAKLDDPNYWDYLVSPRRGLTSLPERSYYKNKKITKDLKSLFAQFYREIGLDQPELRAGWLLDFQTQHSNIYPLPREVRKLYSTRNYMSRKKFLKSYPMLRLNQVFARIPKNLQVRNLTPDSLKFLNDTLKNRPLEQLKSIYLFIGLSSIMDAGYPKYYENFFAFRHKHLGGSAKRPELKERCTMMMISRFRKEIDSELLPVLFPNFPEDKFVSLLEKVRGAIVEGIENNQWLSPQGKQGALNKMKHARFQVVKPKTNEEWDFNLKANYSSSRYIANHELLTQKQMEKELNQLKKKRTRKKWWMGPLTANAYYSSSDNKFVMPIGILQYPFYDPNLPEHVNIGAIGSVVGHELGHGIDDNGSKYDHKGRLKQWLTKQDLKEFKIRGNRMVSQFNKIGHDGKLTLGENIGDLVGLTFAYQAAFPNGKGTTKEKQEFFVQYGRAWCGVIRPKEAERRLKIDPHSSKRARVNEQVKHQKAFQQVFQCKNNDPMVLPEKHRVKVW